MTANESGEILRSPEDLLGATFRCECGKVHFVPVQRIVLEPDAYLRLPEVLRGLSLPREACVVADDNTFDALGEKVVRLLSEEKYGVRQVVLPSPPGGAVKADLATARQLASSLPSVPLLIAVGSGTINDLTKHAAFHMLVPYVVLPTAPSMNGYTSSIVALTISGLKTTSGADPPVAVVADLNVLVESPMELIVSGLGDLVSKPVSAADWKLGQLVEREYFCSRPIRLVEEIEPRYISQAEGIRLRRPEAIRALTEGLLYSGISMTIAGTSSPASGGEHLISHTLDMQADLAGAPHGYHGSQVGVATLFTAALYERVMKEEISSLDVEALLAQEKPRLQQLSFLERYWGPLAGAVAEEFSFKLLPRPRKRKRLLTIRDKWDAMKADLAPFLRPWREIRAALQDGGAPTRLKHIGVSPDQFREAVLHAREMRRRYTVLDLAHDFGLLERHLDDIICETGLSAE